MVGTPPAEISDVNATELGKIVHRIRDPNPAITMTACRGCPSAVTCPIHFEPGSTPSRAIAKMSREAATIATLVFYGAYEQLNPRV